MANIHELIQQHRAFYEVVPYYAVLQERTGRTVTSAQRVQAGFDIDVYGVKASREQEPERNYVLFHAALVRLVETILSHTGNSCSVEVIPFGSTVVFDTKRHFQEEGMVRIRITPKGFGQPPGEPEEQVLQQIKAHLNDLGLSQG